MIVSHISITHIPIRVVILQSAQIDESAKRKK